MGLLDENWEEVYKQMKEKAGRDFSNPKGYAEVLIELGRGTSQVDITAKLEIPQATLSRWLRTLKQYELIDNNSVPTLKHQKSWQLSGNIQAGLLPPPEMGPTVHLLTYLSKFTDEDIIPGYNATRVEIADQLLKTLEHDPDMMYDLIYGLYERLCTYALITKDWNVMKQYSGTIKVPEPS